MTVPTSLLQNNLPERDRQIDVIEVGGLQEHRRNLLPLISSNAAADSSDIEFQLLMLTGKKAETLNSRADIL